MKKRTILSLTLATVVAVCSLTGCSSGSAENISDLEEETEETAEEEAETETAGEETEAAGEETADSADGAEETSVAQELTFVIPGEADTLDPSVTSSGYAQNVFVNCFMGLVTYDESRSVVPGDAESWEISDDGTVYTFHLRDGLKWSDGTDLTAEDYVYTYQRVLKPETTAQYLSMFTDYILGAQEYYDGTATEEELGIQALDDQTLEITLIQPASYFIDILAMWCFFPVQQETVETNGEQWTTSAENYVSNGPFKMEEINLGESYVLVKNENYWNADAVTLEKLTLRIITEDSTALTAYEAGEVDGIRTVPSADYARLKVSDSGLQVVDRYGSTYYNINCSVAPYDDPLVRKALNLAIDRQAIIDSVLQNDATPAYSFLAPGYYVNGEDITADRGTYGLSAEADAEAAQEALAEAGYPDGEGFPTLQLSYYEDDTVKQVAEAIGEMLETNLGIEVEITPNDWAIFYENVQNGDYEVAAMGWGADYLNPMSFLTLFKTGDSNNNAFYSNSEYDALVEQIMTETDASVAAELTMEADAIVSNDYACIPLYYNNHTFLMRDYVTGYYMFANGSMYFQYASVTG